LRSHPQSGQDAATADIGEILDFDLKVLPGLSEVRKVPGPAVGPTVRAAFDAHKGRAELQAGCGQSRPSVRVAPVHGLNEAARHVDDVIQADPVPKSRGDMLLPSIPRATLAG
jgi:hypothetical protein